MKVLGINFSNDSAASLVVDGHLWNRLLSELIRIFEQDSGSRLVEADLRIWRHIREQTSVACNPSRPVARVPRSK